jgi:putative transposase
VGATKHEIPRIREAGDHPARQAVASAGAPHAGQARHSPTTFHRWYDRFLTGGVDALEAAGRGRTALDCIPENVRERIIDLALNRPELSPRELAVTFTDTEGYFVSEASVYRLLQAHDLITSPAFIVTKAADEFQDKTTAPNQLWQTDFTYLR